MRKLVLLFVVFTLAFVFVAPSNTSAQDDGKTIADIVTESASAATPEFTLLLTVIGAADPSVLEALSNPEAELTVFAPTDAAFGAIIEALGDEAVGTLLSDPQALTDILLYHVVEGKVMSADVVAALEATEGFFTAPTLNGQYLDISQDEEGVIYIDDAVLNLEMIDIEAANGVIHVIDAVLLPEDGTLAEVVTEFANAGMMEEGDMEATPEAGMEGEMMEPVVPEFTTLLAAVSAADPSVLEALSNPEAELTVFAPVDAAFAALGEETIATVIADPALLTSILTYHVVEGRFGSAEVTALLEENGGTVEVATLNGANITISTNEDGDVTINGIAVVMYDVDASNGIIHAIEGVLLPQ